MLYDVGVLKLSGAELTTRQGADQAGEVAYPLMFGSLAEWHLLPLLLIALPVVALASIVGMRSRLSLIQIVMWAAIVIVFPAVGSVAWLAFGLRHHRAAHRTRQELASADLAARELRARQADAEIARSLAAAAEQRRNDAWGPF